MYVLCSAPNVVSVQSVRHFKTVVPPRGHPINGIMAEIRVNLPCGHSACVVLVSYVLPDGPSDGRSQISHRVSARMKSHTLHTWPLSPTHLRARMQASAILHFCCSKGFGKQRAENCERPCMPNPRGANSERTFAPQSGLAQCVLTT